MSFLQLSVSYCADWEFCETSDPRSRPTFQELLGKFEDILRQQTMQFQAARAAAGDNTQKEL